MVASLALVPGCLSARLGAGASVDSDGHVGAELQVGVGLRAEVHAVSVVGGLGLAEHRTSSLTVGTYERSTDPCPGRRPVGAQLRLGGRIGARRQHEPDGGRALVLGVGLARLWSPGGYECLDGRLPERRNQVGGEVWLDAQLGDRDRLGWGRATASLVYQHEWFEPVMD